MGFYVSYVEPCHGNPRHENFGSKVPWKTSVVRCRETLVKNFHNVKMAATVAQIEGRVRYSVFKKTVKVMITSTDSLDDLKAQLNTYFEHLGEINIHVTCLVKCHA
ncbi:hypothetical protein MTR_2g007820 [Medicago truncatula]|uniref:Uncharacterized protein n=1 Tax=Medicago truncatula TaxID=3880 RepID=G7IK14_MEDTR|nr:hypothetical protein MTR_2g007820 [Medicago truncatula]